MRRHLPTGSVPLTLLLLSVFLLCLSVGCARASELIDGIYYNLNASAKTAEVAPAPDTRWYHGDIVIPDTVTFNAEAYAVTGIGDAAFRYCGTLTSVTIPESVTSIGLQTFSGCEKLTTVTVPSSVVKIGGAPFQCCRNLTEINVALGNQHWTSVDGVLYDKDVTTLKQCPGAKTSLNIPETVTTIEFQSFNGCCSLTSVTIPEGVKNIGESAFFDCSKLTTITLLSMAQCTTMRKRFSSPARPARAR